MKPSGIRAEHVAETGSTNSDLLARVHAAALAGQTPVLPCLRVAARQTAGRGRHGRRWQAAEGASLTFSLAWPFPASLDLSGLSLVVGVELADALEPDGAVRIGLKWPNDLWLLDGGPGAGTGRKLGGVLIETAPCGAIRVAVIGVGLNVGAVSVPVSVADAGSGVACLTEIDAAATPERTLQRVAEPLIAAVRRFETEGFAPFAARFDARDVLRGHPVAFAAPDDMDGVAVGVSAQGELLVRTARGVLPVRSGEARRVRPQANAIVMSTATATATTC